jgi:hypothetical protein
VVESESLKKNAIFEIRADSGRLRIDPATGLFYKNSLVSFGEDTKAVCVLKRTNWGSIRIVHDFQTYQSAKATNGLFAR